jgi:hypothetical protein
MEYMPMYLLEVALAGVLITACLQIFLTIARRSDRQRRAYFTYRVHVDERDSLARFHRIMGVSTRGAGHS